jgi:hypothetical protein
MSNLDQIARLGFGAWAENIIVNYIEDYSDVIVSSKGSHNIERDDYTVMASWDDSASLSITVRAYVEQDGWQTLDQNIRLKK